MTETLNDIRKRLVNFHRNDEVAPPTLEAFHEWNVEFALKKFREKLTHDPVTFFVFKRGPSMSVLETQYNNEREKRVVFNMIRGVCMEESMGVDMVSSISEVWISSSSVKQPMPQGPVRDMPGREDGLMVSTATRDGGCKITRWVVRLKRNPAKNIVLARDDIDGPTVTALSGQAFGFFSPEQHL